MSGTASGATGRPYGVKLVCRTWEQPRSSYYAHRRAAELPVKVAPPGKRGPRTSLPDVQLLELIRADLAASPFRGEGHRKVWARLRYVGLRTSKRRVLRLMREHQLLAPCRRGGSPGPRVHDGSITTTRVNDIDSLSCRQTTEN